MSDTDPRLERIINWQRARWTTLPDYLKMILWFSLYTPYRLWKGAKSFVKRKTEIEKKLTTNENRKNFEIRKAVAPSISEWNLISNAKPANKVIVDVIVPVYAGVQETLRCLYSVLNSKNNSCFELVVINDCAKPNSLLSRLLRNLSGKFNFTLLENAENQGFVKSTNRGMQLHPDRDVIWLNSDTEVFDHWIDLILDLAEKQPRAAAITPISNNATIYSYPLPNADFPYCLTISDRQLSKICATIHDEYLSSPIETPTGVGFCMFVRRQALNTCGLLDEETFGIGYGEENDLCQRFIQAGWKNLALPSVFVRHFGRVSFKEKTLKLQKAALSKLARIHPTYEEQVRKFIFDDPLKRWRIRLDAERLRCEVDRKNQKSKNGRAVLLISHNLGGGTESYTKDFTRSARKKGFSIYVLTPVSDVEAKINSDVDQFPNLQNLDVKYSKNELVEIIKGLKITDIYINHLIGYPAEFSEILSKILKDDRSLRLEITIHDLYYVCPFATMVRPGSSSLCKDLSLCDNCNKTFKTIPVWKLKENFVSLAKLASVITTPSESTSKFYRSVFPGFLFKTIPHPDNSSKNIIPIKKDKLHPKHVIGILGAIYEHKGYSVVKELAEYCLMDDEISLVVIGYTQDDASLGKLGVNITGKYESEKEARDYIRKYGVTSLFIPSIWPETYCYTLSIALRTGLPVKVFDLGAPAERLNSLDLSQNIIPLEYSKDIKKLVNRLKANVHKDYFFNGHPSNIDEIL